MKTIVSVAPNVGANIHMSLVAEGEAKAAVEKLLEVMADLLINRDMTKKEFLDCVRDWTEMKRVEGEQPSNIGEDGASYYGCNYYNPFIRARPKRV